MEIDDIRPSVVLTHSAKASDAAIGRFKLLTFFDLLNGQSL